MDQIKFIVGGFATDERGTVRFIPDFNLEGIKRFYTVMNHAVGYVRAWHGHKHEAKYLIVLNGAAMVCAAEVKNWEGPSIVISNMQTVILNGAQPGILYIPPGYIHGWKSLTAATQLGVFSTATLEESQADDIRFAARHWDVWDIPER